MAGGNLPSIMNDKSLSESMTKVTAKKLLEVLEFIHAHGVVQLKDLRKNVLFEVCTQQKAVDLFTMILTLSAGNTGIEPK